MRPWARTSGGSRSPRVRSPCASAWGLCLGPAARSPRSAGLQRLPGGGSVSPGRGSPAGRRVGGPTASQAAQTRLGRPAPQHRAPRRPPGAAAGGGGLPAGCAVAHGEGSVAVSTEVCPCRCPPRVSLLLPSVVYLPVELPAPGWWHGHRPRPPPSAARALPGDSPLMRGQTGASEGGSL